MKTVVLSILFVLCALVACAILTSMFVFSGNDHSAYDSRKSDSPTSAPTGQNESAEHAAAAQQIASDMQDAPKLGRKEMMAVMRKQMDERGESTPIHSAVQPVQVNGLPAEWVIAPGADPERRLLYIHGGGYVMGSPKSHRPITSRLSEVAGAAVLAIDYRLQPEHPRMAGIEDCRTAYQWLLENGPEGPSEAKTLFVAGDSSGGNLTLSTLAWARDSDLRAADAAVVFSPQTDATLASPSLVDNIDTDVMQGPAFGPVVKAPRVISLWFSFLMNRINPSNPVVSPLLGDLADLPPTLIQVSEDEMFLDDAVRYANKANAQGSEVVLQIWPHLMHVWQAFQVPEADEAFAKVAEFLASS